MSNNVRHLAFEQEVHRIHEAAQYPHMLFVSPITVPVRASEFAADSAHYKAPVNLAIIDLIFGPLIQHASEEAV